MGAYLIRRLLLVIPTLWAIITINFFIVQIAPGGPVDQAIAAIEFGNSGGMPGGGGEGMGASHARTGVGNISESHYRGGRGLDPEVIAEITHRYGFDKPIHERYFKMLWDYIRFDFGDSLFPQCVRINVDQAKPAGFGHAGAVGDADYLSGLYTARDPKSGA